LLRRRAGLYLPPVNWTAVRDEFPILSRATYLNSCSLGALSRSALQRVATFHEEWHTYGASAWYETWTGRLDELRRRVATLIGAAPAEVALTASTSAGLSVIASALDYGARNRVVVSELDFPTVAYQWLVRPGVEVVRVPSDDGVAIDPARMAAAIDHRTAAVAISHVFFTTGAIQQTAEIAEAARRHDALFIIDAYQSAGQVPVSVQALGADVLMAGPLKWLLGGPGLAWVYVRDEWIRRLEPQVTGWFAARDQFAFDGATFDFRDDAQRFELGTPALSTVHAALGGHDVIDRFGIAAIRSRNAELTEHLIRALHERGFGVHAAADPAARSAIVMVPDPDAPGVVQRLARHGVIVDARPGRIRVSPHFYNTVDELDRFVEILASGDSP
jgi:kynureninase